MMRGIIEKRFIIFITLSILFLFINLSICNAILINDFSSELNPTPSFDLQTASDDTYVNFPLTATSSPPEALPEFMRQPLSNYGVIRKVTDELVDYFVNLRDPETGLFVDFGSAEDPTVDLGITPTGYGLTALTTAVEWGLIEEDEAKKWVNKALDSILKIQKKQFSYEKDLINYLEDKFSSLSEEKKEEIIADFQELGEEMDLEVGLESKGWGRFWALEVLRDEFEIEFLKKKRGLNGAYNRELGEFKKENGIKPDEELNPRQLNEFHKAFLRNHSDIYKFGRWGFLYRYLTRDTMEKSLRGGLNDLSSVDTAYLITGVLTAGKYFGEDTWEKAKRIYENVNWHMMLNPRQWGDKPNIFSMGWIPEVPEEKPKLKSGFLKTNWDMYTDESVLLTLLALGSPKPSADSISTLLFGHTPGGIPKEVYYSFNREKGDIGGMPDITLTPEGGLWSYTANIWFDTHNKKDETELNWYQNASKATLANRNIVLNMKDSEGKTLAERYQTFNEHLWPVTTMWTPLRSFGSRWAQSSADQGGYHMDIGVVRPDISPIELYDKIPPLVAPNGYGGSIIHSLYSYLGLRYLGSTEVYIWGDGGFYDAFSYDIDFHERLGGEWFAPVQVAFSQGQFLQMFNLLGEISDNKKSIWEITNDIPYFQKAFKKAGLKEIPILDSTPDELLDDIREEVAGEIESLSILIDSGDNKGIIERFDNLIDNYLTKDKATMGEYDELVKVLKEKMENNPFNPLLGYMIAETRMAQIRNIAIAATGEKYVNQGDYYKTFEAIKYYFKNVDKYYKQAKFYLRMAQDNISSVDSDSLRYLLNTKAKALDFILTKNTFYDYNEQKELFKQTAELINKVPVDMVEGLSELTIGKLYEKRGELIRNLADMIAEMIYRYDWEAELLGALSYDRIYQDLLYWEEDYDFDNVRTPVYPRLEE